MADPARSPRTGDRVRAERSHRDATPVTGILHLRFIPSLNYVQVNVVLDSGRSVSVDPQSVGVVEAGVVPVEELEANDPVVSDPGWRRVIDLDGATSRGPRPTGGPRRAVLGRSLRADATRAPAARRRGLGGERRGDRRDRR